MSKEEKGTIPMAALVLLKRVSLKAEEARPYIEVENWLIQEHQKVLYNDEITNKKTNMSDEVKAPDAEVEEAPAVEEAPEVAPDDSADGEE